MGGEGGRDGGRKVDACVRKAGVCAGGGGGGQVCAEGR